MAVFDMLIKQKLNTCCLGIREGLVYDKCNEPKFYNFLLDLLWLFVIRRFCS